MAGGKNLMTGLLVLVVVGVLVYLVDPTFFGLLKGTSGFEDGDDECEAGLKRDPVTGECVEPFQGGQCEPPLVYDEETGECVEGFANLSSSTSTGEAGPGQMSNPGATNLTNVMGNQHAVAGNLTTGSNPEPFADLGEGPANFGTAQQPAGCYPRDQLTPSELLPKDQNSVWAEQNPMGPGSLKGKNFLSAGALIGVNTVGQSLRNANWQLRSEPPNPQVPVSIFNQSTIQPDTNRRPLEIN